MKEEIEKELGRSGAISIVRLCDLIIAHAHEEGASDVHIDPTESLLLVRFRIDGELVLKLKLARRIQLEIIARIKVMAHLRSDEHQTPQDGRFKAGEMDVRVSIVPTYYGENAVLRLLARPAAAANLSSLGFSDAQSEYLLRALQNSYGMILVTGPTGSGKTSTLYSLIEHLAARPVSIVTIEEPIEYAISGVRQIQVNPRTGLTFSNGLRSILRQDPNVIMVGEIRDRDTAGIAINAALTGHLLLSTLHTNSAASTLPRLLDMGVDAYLIASTVRVVVAQRLVRRICQGCKGEVKLKPEEAAFIQKYAPGQALTVMMQGAGCSFCGGTGYKGRIVISEILQINDEISRLLTKRAAAYEIEFAARRAGMKTLAEEGFSKVAAGDTTLQELMKILNDDQVTYLKDH